MLRALSSLRVGGHGPCTWEQSGGAAAHHARASAVVGLRRRCLRPIARHPQAQPALNIALQVAALAAEGHI